MSKKRVLIFSLLYSIVICACIQTISRPDRPSEPIMIDGTPYDNPMAAIEKFAMQTAAAQTRIAEPYHLSNVQITPMPPDYSSETKVLHVVFPDGDKKSYSPFEIGSLPRTTIIVNGQEFIGVSLNTFLQQAGWDAFDVSAISLNGTGSLTILKDQITQDYLLVLTGSSIKFISSSISESLWIDGVALIEVY